jgi:hypothetical protein
MTRTLGKIRPRTQEETGEQHHTLMTIAAGLSGVLRREFLYLLKETSNFQIGEKRIGGWGLGTSYLEPLETGERQGGLRRRVLVTSDATPACSNLRRPYALATQGASSTQRRAPSYRCTRAPANKPLRRRGS